MAKKKLKRSFFEEAKNWYKDVLARVFKNKNTTDEVKVIPNKLSGTVLKSQEPSPEQLQPLINLFYQGQLEQALSQAADMLEQFPSSPILHDICGVSHAGLGKFDAAIESHKQALKIKPDHFEAYYNMGNTLRGKGYLDAAIESYKKALKIKPDFAEAYNNMGRALHEQGDRGAAIESYQQALKVKPEYAEAYNNRGIVLQELGNLDAAIKSYQQALKVKPEYAEAYTNIGDALAFQGDLGAAIENYQQALKIKPDSAAVEGNLLHQLQHICDWASADNLRGALDHLGITTEAVLPFTLLSIEDDAAKHLVRSQAWVAEKYKQPPLLLPARPKVAPNQLRVGYFSADFNYHPVALLMAKVFETHDRGAFQIYGYSIGPAGNDAVRARLVKGFDVFDDVQELSDRDVVKLARQDNIDIAVDLTGYTRNSRSNIFALRAAPVQISYLGYPGSMGAEFIDYIIADETLIPAASQKFYSEKPIYLPHHYQAQDDELPIASETPSRSSLGLPESGFVFCAMNNTFKITPSEFDIWMRLLKKVNGSVLWLREGNRWAKENLLKEAQARGVNPDRLVFDKKCGHEKYLAQFRQADLYLDTFVYNAGATASNALWAGLPVLTKLGQGYTARMAGSLLNSIGLPELIASSEKNYEELALKLATEPSRLASIRQKLATNRLTSPLFNTELFTRHLEQGYAQAYQRYFDGQDPAAIFVS